MPCCNFPTTPTRSRSTRPDRSGLLLCNLSANPQPKWGIYSLLLLKTETDCRPASTPVLRFSLHLVKTGNDHRLAIRHTRAEHDSNRQHVHFTCFGACVACCLQPVCTCRCLKPVRISKFFRQSVATVVTKRVQRLHFMNANGAFIA